MAGEDLNASMLRAQQAANQATAGKGIFGIRDTDVFSGTSLKATGFGDKMVPSLATIFKNRNADRSGAVAVAEGIKEVFRKAAAEAPEWYAGVITYGGEVSAGAPVSSGLAPLDMGSGPLIG